MPGDVEGRTFLSFGNGSICCGFETRPRGDSFVWNLCLPAVNRCQSLLSSCWENRSPITAGGDLSGREPKPVHYMADY